MYIEVAGTNTANKGAELMLAAIKQQLANVRGLKLATEPSFGKIADRQTYHLETIIRPKKIGRTWIVAQIMPESVRRTCGLVVEPEIDAVLDASGFAFSDELGPVRTERFADDVHRWKRQGKPVILLPQALGPFRTPRVRKAFLRVVENANLIFARDCTSFEYLTELTSNPTNLRLAPDFTNLVTAEPPQKHEIPDNTVLIVPNYRMIEKTRHDLQQLYVPFLVSCIGQIRELGLRPAILLHDDNLDKTFIPYLQREITNPPPVIDDPSPIGLKGILGAARLVIGSRFHALVGALSQGVPCIAAGWSHKYDTLMQAYNCPETLVPVDASQDKLRELIKFATSTEGHHDLVKRITESCARQELAVKKMWQEVTNVLGFDLEKNTSSEQK